MKSTQISSMFISLTKTEEASLCGGENLVLSNGVYNGVVKKIKVASGKKGVKKQTVKSSTTLVTKKTTKVGKISQSELLNSLGLNLSSLL